MEETVKESTIFKEEMTKVFVNGENTMPVGDIDQLEGHAGGAFHGVLIAASGTETAVTTEGNEFKLPAFRTAVHCTAIRRVTTMNHLLDVFNHSVARMKSIYHFFIMISEDFLQNIHMISMKKRGTKSNPLMNEGVGGAEVPQALFYMYIILPQKKICFKMNMLTYRVFAAESRHSQGRAGLRQAAWAERNRSFQTAVRPAF